MENLLVQFTLVGLVSVALLCACSSSKDHYTETPTDSTLSTEERSKIDEDLLRLMTDTVRISDVPSRQRPDSTWEYAVRVRTTDVEALQEAGLSTDRVERGTVSTWLSLAEIRTVAQLESVQAVRADNDPVPRKKGN